MPRDSIVFYRSFFEALKVLDPEEKAQAYDAVFEYGLNDNLVEMGGLTAAMFGLIKPQLDANNRRYMNGLKGGRKPKQNQDETKPEPKANLDQTETEANVNVNDNANVNENVNDNKQRGKAAKTIFDHSSNPYRCASYLDQCICERITEPKPAAEATLQSWADVFDKVNRIDGKSWKLISEVLTFSQEDEFWKKQILSALNFRKHFLKMSAQMGGAR